MNLGVSRYEATQGWVADGAVRTWSFWRICLPDVTPSSQSGWWGRWAGEKKTRQENVETKKSWQTATIFLALSPTEPPNLSECQRYLLAELEHLSTGQVYNSGHVQKGADNLTLSTLAICFFKPWLTSAVQVSGKYLTFLANPSWSKEIRKREVRRQAMT